MKLPINLLPVLALGIGDLTRRGMQESRLRQQEPENIKRSAKSYARKLGIWRCPGKTGLCGKIISANKDYCLECSQTAPV